jgi:hypothetical protein
MNRPLVRSRQYYVTSCPYSILVCVVVQLSYKKARLTYFYSSLHRIHCFPYLYCKRKRVLCVPAFLSSVLFEAERLALLAQRLRHSSSWWEWVPRKQQANWWLGFTQTKPSRADRDGKTRFYTMATERKQLVLRSSKPRFSTLEQSVFVFTCPEMSRLLCSLFCTDPDIPSNILWPSVRNWILSHPPHFPYTEVLSLPA